MKPQSLSTLTRVIILAAFYLVGGVLGNASFFLKGTVGLVWPPFGIALAAILLFGYRFWPGVALGSVLFSLVNGTAFGVEMAGTVVGSTVGAVLCAYLLERFVGFKNSLERVRDVAGLVALACLLGTTVTAAFNVAALNYGDALAWDEMFPTLMEWWVPNAMAGLVVTPVILTWGSPSFTQWNLKMVAEAVVCVIGLAVGSLISFNSWYVYGIENYPLAYLPYPFLVWAALRFGQRGATAGTLVVSTLAIYELLQGKGPFVANTEKESLMLIGSYIGILAVTNMLLAAAATERQRAEAEGRQSEERFRIVARATNDAVWDWDLHTNSMWRNEGLRTIFGYAESQVGRDVAWWHEQIHPEDRAQVVSGIDSFLQTGGQLWSAEYRFRRPDSSYAVVLDRAFVLRDRVGKPIRMIGATMDITARKEIEENLARARDAALETARLKAEFLANMSHEIRTPMNGVIGMTNLLLDTPLNKQQHEFVETIRASSDSLLTIINDILDFSKIEAGKLQFEIIDLDLRETVESTLDLLAERAHAKGLELAGFVHPDVPTRLRGDPGRLRQVLMNLVGNAIKFTERGEVVLRVQREEETEQHVLLRFEVKDTGIGIPAEAQSRLFQTFTQADGSTTRRYGGTGLGLAIARQLVTMMSGKIGLNSETGVGSTFWFTVRLEKQSAPGTAFMRRREGLVNLKVLIVDDNATNRTILQYQTAAWKMQNESASSGPEALEMLRRAAAAGKPFDLGILDMHMPGMDGLSLAQSIHRDSGLTETRLIMLSSLGNLLEPSKLAEMGIDDCLLKPVRQSRLFDTLISLVNRGSARPADEGRPSPVATITGSEGLGGIRVLLAEDHTINQKVAVGMLRRLGLGADVVPNGRDALEAMGRIPYDVVLMDCQMPVMDGYESTRKIRQLSETGNPEPTRPPYIIAMTANAMQGDREKCLDAGMDDYVSKPIQLSDLREALQRWRPDLRFEAIPSNPPVSLTVQPRPAGEASPVDVARLEEVGLGEREKIRRLVQLYLTQADELLKGLEDAVQAGSAEDIHYFAHKLGGASSNCGISAVVPPLRELESRSQSRQLENAGALNGEVRRQFELARRFLEEYMNAG